LGFFVGVFQVVDLGAAVVDGVVEVVVHVTEAAQPVAEVALGRHL
jgi:hypothetical protein